jgi:hypothetical protein
MVACSVLACALPTFAQSSEANTQDYAHVIAEALREFDAGHFEEARALFLRANELQPSARTMRALGFAEFELRHYVAADRWLRSAMADKRNPLTPEQRSDVDATLARIRTFVGRYRLDCDPASASFTLDGQPLTLEPDRVLLLEMGEHVLTASAPGRAQASEQIDVRGGEDTTLHIALAPASASAEASAAASNGTAPSSGERSRANALPWVLVIGGAGLTVGGVVLFALGRGAAADVEDPKDGASYASIKSAQSRAPVLSNVGIALAAGGLVSAGIGVVLFTHKKSDRGAPAASVAISPAGVNVSGAF